tara:strand:- start:760 stop:1707 length:948 start_codon:yes stop_codon:yes gene_type:complete
MDSSVMNFIERGKGPWPKANDERSVRDWFVKRMSPGVEEGERLPMAGFCLDFVSQKGRGERMMSEFRYSESLIDKLALICDGLVNGLPVQYLTSTAHFDDLDLFVDSSVLIPRPETEELVFALSEKIDKLWGVKGLSGNSRDILDVLDIGTGSGCISLSIKNRVPRANVFATDFSKKAIEVASKNANSTGLDVTFECSDILLETPFNKKPFDAVVSNPPYIPVKEKKDMSSRVLDHEPSSALFVPDEDPFIFYKAIVSHCMGDTLRPGGILALECHEDFTLEVKMVIEDSGSFSGCEMILDLQGKNRHLIALKNV